MNIAASTYYLQLMFLLKKLHEHVITALLFIVSDLKTILFPVCDSNNEDAINKPWCPLPSNRVTVAQAKFLRWIVVGVCQLASAFFGVNEASTLLTVTTILHDDLNLSRHWIGKTIYNSLGYLSFELGATQIVGGGRGYIILMRLTAKSTAALLCSAAVIILTIHAQDFADVTGDIKSGRITLPIAYPRASRIYMFTALPICSIFLSFYWSSKLYITMPLIVLSLVVGGRLYWLRGAADDTQTFRFYNVWLLSVHVFPSLAGVNPY
ncbi:hypothetical protein B0H14DRAFT_3108445 [Mycena olivaceomarginata]|nr:hypothetical protein B0H14DRAFT_3108445 [Mycena olivaceomarginata]